MYDPLNVKFYNKGFNAVTWLKVLIPFDVPIGIIILYQTHWGLIFSTIICIGTDKEIYQCIYS